MSHYMTALAMKQVGLKPATKIVLYWLADHHNGETGRCFPSLARLCKVTEMGKTALTGHLNSLESMGLIERIRKQDENGAYKSTEYVLRLKDNTPVRNADNPCSDFATPLVRNADTNLVRNNLGNEPIGQKPKKASQLPENWVCSDKNWQDAIDRGFSAQEIDIEQEQFRNYHHSKGSTMKSWDAAWRTWLGNARKFAGNKKSPTQDDFLSNIEKLARLR